MTSSVNGLNQLATSAISTTASSFLHHQLSPSSTSSDFSGITGSGSGFGPSSAAAMAAIDDVITTSFSNYGNSTMIDYSNYDNDGIYFDHPEEMLVPWKTNAYFFPIVVTYVITFIVGVSGNLVVIWVMAGDRAARSVTSVFLVSLAVADLLFLTIYTPLEVAHYFVVQWDKDGTVCKLAAYAESVSAFASVLNLVAVTFERFVVIVFPIRSRSVCTMSNCKRLMVVVWFLSLSLATPVIFIKIIQKTTFYNDVTSVTMFSCKDNADWTGFVISIYRLTTLFALPSLVMIACYTWVIIELWISTKTMDELTQSASIAGDQRSQVYHHPQRPESRASISHEPNSGHHSPTHHRVILRSHGQSDSRDVKKARQQVIKMLILVVILFLICWGPRLFMESIIKCCLSAYNHSTYTMRIIFYLLPFVHSCLNPIVYCFMSSKFRRRMLRCFERQCNQSKSNSKIGHNGQANGNYSMKTSASSVSRTNATHLTSVSVYTLTSVSPTNTLNGGGVRTLSAVNNHHHHHDTTVNSMGF